MIFLFLIQRKTYNEVFHHVTVGNTVTQRIIQGIAKFSTAYNKPNNLIYLFKITLTSYE